MIQRQCLQWVTVPHGQTGDSQRRPGYPRYSRCLPWLARWDMRCALSSDRQIPHDNNLEIDHPLTRTGVFRSEPRTGRNYSRIRCFSCGQFGHMQSRCPQPHASLPFKPAGWFLQSDGRQQRDGDNQTGNSP